MLSVDTTGGFIGALRFWRKARNIDNDCKIVGFKGNKKGTFLQVPF